jgi:hypothetical protein
MSLRAWTPVLLSLAACGTRREVTREELIARNTEAMGGARAIEAIDRIEVALRIFERGAELEGLYRADRQGRMRIDIRHQGRRVYTEAFDGKRGWQMGEDGIPRPQSKEGEAALWHGTQFPGQLFGLHEMERRGHRVELIGRERRDGLDYYVLKLILSDGFETFRLVSPSTWLIERGRDFRALHPDADAGKKWLENRFFDFRRVAGVLRAFRSEQLDAATGAALQKTELTRVVPNPEFPPDLFAPPAALN